MSQIYMNGAADTSGGENVVLENLTVCNNFEIQQNGNGHPAEGDNVVQLTVPRIIVKEIQEYDPHKNRKQDAPTNNFETWIHLLKGSLGTGILAMPNAFLHAGLLLGLFGTLFIGAVCTYCMHVLIRTQYQICKALKEPTVSYPQSMMLALEKGPSFLRFLAPYSGVIINTFLVVYQLGICCVYIVFVSTSIKQVVEPHWPDVDVRLYMVMILVPLIVMNWIPNLKILAPFSTVANVLIFVGLGVVLYYIFKDIPSPSIRPFLGNVHDIPLFIGTTLFALEAVGVIIALENNMKTPQSFLGYTGVLNRGMSVIVVLYAFLGFVGYVQYGNDTLGSITLNLPQGEWLADAVKILFAIAIFITYALQCYVAVEIIWDQSLKHRCEKYPRWKQIIIEYLLRTSIVLVTFCLAAAIPRLELFISLFGALCLSAVGIVFPALIELCYLWPDNRCSWVMFKDILLMAFGLTGLVVGTYTSISDIIKSLM